MTPDDLRAFRVQHSLPQSALAAILGLGRHTILAMEMGRQIIPAWMGLALSAHQAGLKPYVAPDGIEGRKRISRSSGRSPASA